MTILGAGQANFVVGDPAANRDLIQSLLDEADQAGVEILVLPELASSGYALQDAAEAQACAELAATGPLSRILARWSQAGRLVVCGLCERDSAAPDARLYNSAVVFGEGVLKAVYRKVHLFMNEGLIFGAGEQEPPVIEFQGHKIGVLICYDWAFPEMGRILALQGAQVLLHPSNLVLPYGQQAMITRSIENRVFSVTANRFGLERGIPFSGCSQIVSAGGELLARAGAETHGVITAGADLAQADDKRITPFNHLFGDRKPALYRRITDPD